MEDRRYKWIHYRVLKWIKNDMLATNTLDNTFVAEVVKEIDEEIQIRKSKLTLILWWKE